MVPCCSHQTVVANKKTIGGMCHQSQDGALPVRIFIRYIQYTLKHKLPLYWWNDRKWCKVRILAKGQPQLHKSGSILANRKHGISFCINSFVEYSLLQLRGSIFNGKDGKRDLRKRSFIIYLLELTAKNLANRNKHMIFSGKSKTYFAVTLGFCWSSCSFAFAYTKVGHR